MCNVAPAKTKVYQAIVLKLTQSIISKSTSKKYIYKFANKFAIKLKYSGTHIWFFCSVCLIIIQKISLYKRTQSN